MQLRTKVFEESRVLKRIPGSLNQWSEVSKTAKLDQTINDWLKKTGNTIVSVTAPGFDMRWLDNQMTVRSVLLAVVVIYKPGKEEVNYDEQRVEDIGNDEGEQWPEYVPDADEYKEHESIRTPSVSPKRTILPKVLSGPGA